MIKQNFVGSVRAKGKVATVNEMLCKVLCHNIWVVIKTAYELHVDDQFWPKDE